MYLLQLLLIFLAFCCFAFIQLLPRAFLFVVIAFDLCKIFDNWKSSHKNESTK